MSRKSRLSSLSLEFGLPLTKEAIGKWTRYDEGGLQDQRLELFTRRKRAVLAYLDGKTDSEIRAETTLCLKEARRFLRRCLSTDSSGRLFEWVGIAPFARLTAPVRSKEIKADDFGYGTTGALSELFSSQNGRDLKQRFIARILATRTKSLLEEGNKSRASHFKWFIGECEKPPFNRREKGLWPFNVERQGYVTICKFIDSVLDEHPVEALRLDGPEAVKKAKTGDGTQRPDFPFMTRVECDAHHLDVHAVVLVPHPDGSFRPVKIKRLWVIVIVETKSTAVLGFHLSIRREPSADDVLQALKMALSKWELPELYHIDKEKGFWPGAGMPSTGAPALVGACFDEFSVDGALAGRCETIRKKLEVVTQARVISPMDPDSFSKRRSKDDRPYIEAFFRKLGQLGFHRLAVSTKDSPKSLKGRKPQAVAEATHFQLEYVWELLCRFIANANADAKSTLGGRTPNQQAAYWAMKQGSYLRYADPDSVKRLLCTEQIVTVTGRPQRIHYKNASYSSDWLRKATHLQGKQVRFSLEDEHDARLARVTSLEGEVLGVVLVNPPWHLSAHTIFMRAAITKLQREKRLPNSECVDPVESFVLFAESGEDSKLPAHPAYLEARRVLQIAAEKQSGKSMVSVSKESMDPYEESESPASEMESTSDNEGEDDVQLPAPRNAQYGQSF